MTQGATSMAMLRQNLMSGSTLVGSITPSGILEKAEQAEKMNLDVEGELGDIQFITSTVVRLNGRLCRLSATAMGQLGSIFGVKWDKWFAVDGVDPGRVQEELDVRLKANRDEPAFGMKMFRLRKLKSEDRLGSGFIIRGILSKAYTPIDDLRILKIIQGSLGSDLLGAAARVTSNPWSEASCDQNTNVTFFLNQPIEVQNGKKDIFYPGVHFANSEVGKRSVTLEDALMRVICTNGMIRVINSNVVFRQVHKRIEDQEVTEKLAEVTGALRRDISQIPARILASHKHTYTEKQFEDAVDRFIVGNRLPLSFGEAVDDAFKQEPDLSRFGLIQALTLASHSLSAENAYTVERAASQLLN